jgi:hypothetical protein
VPGSISNHEAFAASQVHTQAQFVAENRTAMYAREVGTAYHAVDNLPLKRTLSDVTDVRHRRIFRTD